MGRIEGGGGGGGGGVTDHGALTGLSDDDHTQYATITGTRAPPYVLTATGSIGTGVIDYEITGLTNTKRYLIILRNWTVSTDAESTYLDIEFAAGAGAPTGAAGWISRFKSDTGISTGNTTAIREAMFGGTLDGRVHIWCDFVGKRIITQWWCQGASYGHWGMAASRYTATSPSQICLALSANTHTGGTYAVYEEIPT